MFRENQIVFADDWRTDESRYGSGIAAGRTIHSETPVPESEHLTRPEHLTRLEQTVVALSLFDAPSSIEPPRALMRGIIRLFGLRLVNRLADDRLEALRRYCILLRRSGGAPAGEDLKLMRDAHFSVKALDQISRLVALGRIHPTPAVAACDPGNRARPMFDTAKVRSAPDVPT